MANSASLSQLLSVSCSNLGCGKSFPLQRGKRFCGTTCKQQGHRKEKAALDKKLFNEAILAQPLDTPQGAPHKNGDWRRMGPQLGITQNAPTEATYYRVGAPKLGVERHGEWFLRWFPTYRMCDGGVFSLDPFQFPLVPHPGEYLVAYFDERQRLIAEPEHRVEIFAALAADAWSLGDRLMETKFWLRRVPPTDLVP